MNKLTYNTPVVEITAWDKADVITTSGVTVNSGVIAEVGDSNNTASVDFTSVWGN